jgi:hypothetical protein
MGELPSLNGVTQPTPLPVDASPGATGVYDITSATTIKASPGRLIKISVVVAGSAAGTANDCAATGSVATGNEICPIPASVGIITLDWQCASGITITPGTGQTLAALYY